MNIHLFYVTGEELSASKLDGAEDDSVHVVKEKIAKQLAEGHPVTLAYDDEWVIVPAARIDHIVVTS